MMIGVRLAIATFTIATLTTAPAVAGVADSPLPLLDGRKSKHVFSVPGVMKNGTLETLFSCTSLEKAKAVEWAVELFSPTGGAPQNDATTNSASLSGGGDTDTIGTNTVAAFSVTGVVVGALTSNSPRSARILSTSTKIMCSAYVVDATTNPPTNAYSLRVIKKTKQKGE